MEINIRIANERDINALFDIRTNVRENHLSLQQVADLRITPAAIRTEIMTSTTSRTWIAEIADVPVGFAIARADDGNLFALFIRPEWEGHGIGRRLLEKAEAFLFEQYATIWLETKEKSRAYGFYRHFGWAPVKNDGSGDLRMEKTVPYRR